MAEPTKRTTVKIPQPIVEWMELHKLWTGDGPNEVIAAALRRYMAFTIGAEIEGRDPKTHERFTKPAGQDWPKPPVVDPSQV